jgi:hypothetical protein
MTRTLGAVALGLVSTTVLALALGGCKIDHRPLLARGGPAPAATAPSPGPLDPGYAAPAPAPTAAAYELPPAEAYAYPARAYGVSRDFQEAPPAYAFGYGEEQPWVWDAPDNGTMFAEPIGEGYRYYYYDPDEPYPYFVQDSGYGYAYGPDGALIALFDAAGVLLSAQAWGPVEYRAHDYWRRGYDLDETFRRSPRYRVDPGVWRERAPGLVASRERWFRAAATQPAWRRAADAGWAAPRREARPLPGWSPDRGRRIAQAAPQSSAPDHRGGAVGPQAIRGEQRPGPGRQSHQSAPPALARADGRQGEAGPHGAHSSEAGRSAQTRDAERGPAPAMPGGRGARPGRIPERERHAQPQAPHPPAGWNGGGHDGGRALAEAQGQHGAPRAARAPSQQPQPARLGGGGQHFDSAGGGAHFAREGGPHGGGSHPSQPQGAPPGRGQDGGHAGGAQSRGGGHGGGHDTGHGGGPHDHGH